MVTIFGPCDRLVNCPGCSPPSSVDSYDWPQPTPTLPPRKRLEKYQKMDRWMYFFKKLDDLKGIHFFFLKKRVKDKMKPDMVECQPSMLQAQV